MIVSPKVLRNIREVMFSRTEPPTTNVMWAKPIGNSKRSYTFYVFSEGKWRVMSSGGGDVEIPENISYFNNDVGYITAADLPTIPSKVSQLQNDSGYITDAVLGNYALKSELFSGNYGDLANTPIKGPISASELDNITEPGIYFVEGVNALGLPTYSWVTVEMTYSAAQPNRYLQTSIGGGEIKIRSKTESSSYDNWTIPYQKPKTTLEGYGITDAKIENGVITLGNNTVDTNSYLLSSDISDWAKASTKPSYTAAEVGALPDDTPLFSGNYNDLSNKPTIPIIPSNVSAFTNDAGYLTSHQDISGKEDKIIGEDSASSTLTASFGKYYRFTTAADSFTINLPATGQDVQAIMFWVPTGTGTPQITFNPNNSEAVYHMSDYSLEASAFYEVNALWNGAAWVITYNKFELAV